MSSADTPLPEPTEKGSKTVGDLFREIDADLAARAANPASFGEAVDAYQRHEALHPVSFKRLVSKPPISPGAPTTDPTPGTAPGSVGAGTATPGGDAPAPYPSDYHEWLRAVEAKYGGAMRVRSTPDFIDLDLLNTVMADYGGTFAEVSREAREYLDASEDAKEQFDLWWDGKVSEARELAKDKKITSDTGLQAFARATFAAEYEQRRAIVKDTARRADFMSTMKGLVKDSGSVLKGLAPSLAFEISTSGGLKFEANGNVYFGGRARRIGDRPPPHAVMMASRGGAAAPPR